MDGNQKFWMEIKNSGWKLKILDGNPEKEIKNSGWKLKILGGNPEILEIEIQSPLLNVRVHIAPKLDLQVACLNLVGHRPQSNSSPPSRD